MASSASPITKSTIAVAKGVPALRAGEGNSFLSAQVALAHRNHPDRRIPAGAFHLQLRGNERRGRL